MPPSIIVDSASPDLVYAGAQWEIGTDPQAFSGSYNTCRTDVNSTTGIPASFTLAFIGTGISFYGQPTDDFKLNYTFDGTNPRMADIDPPRGIPGKTGVRLWGVENVTATSHTVTFIPIAGRPILDYIVVTPYSSVFLDKKILALDDTDPAINYSGNWTSQSGTVFPGGLAYNNTRHGSTTSGDKFTIAFTGSSISVYGILNQIPGNHSSTYSIDGGPSSTYDYVYNTTQPTQDSWLLNQKFFSKDVIPGDHNLTVTVDKVSSSQVFSIDYVLFEGIPSTKLSPIPNTPTTPPIKQSTVNKIIEGVVVTIVVGGILFCCLRVHLTNRITNWFKQYKQYKRYDLQQAGARQSRDPTPPSTIPPPFPTPIVIYGSEDYETRRLRIEMENLRRETEAIRIQSQSQRVNHERPAPERPQNQDAGPADSPPPYSPTNYIP